MTARRPATVTWRGDFTTVELAALHDEAFGPPASGVPGPDWRGLVERYSLGWVTARTADGGGALLGFVNVIGDGMVHAWLQDVMVARSARHQGIGELVVRTAADGARSAGCAWLHVDFGADLRPFYVDACGFTPSSAGLLRL